MAGEGSGDFCSAMKRLMAERVEARKRRRDEAEHPGPMGDTPGPPGTVGGAPGPPGPVPLGLLAAVSPPGTVGGAPGPPGPVPLGLLAAVSPQLIGHPPTAQGAADTIASSSLAAKIARKAR